jgi:uncharacterized membrane protein
MMDANSGLPQVILRLQASSGRDFMRRLLDLVSLLLLVVILAVTGFAIAGPGKLPEKIPTHLDPLGLPDAWVTRSSLEILPVISVVVFLVLGVVAAYSSLAKHADQQEPASGPPLEALILKLIVAIKAELLAIFTCLQLSSLHAARHSGEPSSFWSIMMWIVVAATFATVAWSVTAMIRMDRSAEQVAP